MSEPRKLRHHNVQAEAFSKRQRSNQFHQNADRRGPYFKEGHAWCAGSCEIVKIELRLAGSQRISEAPRIARWQPETFRSSRVQKNR
jgi:hypothetical protein